MNIFFKDYPHKNTYLSKGDKKLVRKSIKDKDIQLIEYEAEKFLAEFSICPKVYEYNNDFFLEEFIYGETLLRIDFNDNLLKILAIKLKKLHSLEPTEKLKGLLSRDLNSNQKYYLTKVFKNIIAENRSKIENYINLNKIYFFIKQIEISVNTNKYSLSLIHGDLSGNNIIIDNDGNIKLIDFSDVRYDIATADIAQFFYLNKLNKTQQEIFLNYYNLDVVVRPFLDCNHALILLYDLVHQYINKGTWNKYLIKRVVEYVD